ncbi:MAG: endolytic transglycosylase MltG [Thermomicrobiales bacterium]
MPRSMRLVRFMVQSLKVVTILAMAIGVAVGGRQFFDYYVDRQADPATGRPVAFSVGEEDDGAVIAVRLQESGLIRSEFYFSSQLRVTSGQLRPGEYTLRRGMSVNQIIDRITDDGDAAEDDAQNAADASAPRGDQVTFQEGLRLEEFAAIVEDSGLIEGGGEAFLEAARQDWSGEFDFLAGAPSVEGFLFPDTYTLTTEMAAEDVVRQMLQQFDAVFTADLRRQAEDRGLTVLEVVTLASIVERETADPSERGTIAGTYLNRVDSVDTNGTFGADPTVQYILGTEADWWPELEPDQQFAPETDTPYNTYVASGFPPGPICNPGQASLEAAVNPEEVPFLYFVARNDGTGLHEFAETYDQHLINIELYQNGGG